MGIAYAVLVVQHWAVMVSVAPEASTALYSNEPYAEMLETFQ